AGASGCLPANPRSDSRRSRRSSIRPRSTCAPPGAGARWRSSTRITATISRARTSCSRNTSISKSTSRPRPIRSSAGRFSPSIPARPWPKLGDSEIRFTEAASLRDQTSVHLRPAGRGGEVAILYQDYRYDLASTDKLLEKYVDQQIDVATKDDQVKRGTLLAFDPSSLVIQEPGGSVSLLNRAEVRQVGVRELPKGLITRPTLVWRVRATG